MPSEVFEERGAERESLHGGVELRVRTGGAEDDAVEDRWGEEGAVEEERVRVWRFWHGGYRRIDRSSGASEATARP